MPMTKVLAWARHPRGRSTVAIVVAGALLATTACSSGTPLGVPPSEPVVTLDPTLQAAAVASRDRGAAYLADRFAIIDPLLSYRNTTDKVRQILYGVLGLAQSGGLLAAVLLPTAPEVLPIASAVVTVISSTLSRFYTPTSTMAASVPAIPSPRRTPWPV